MRRRDVSISLLTSTVGSTLAVTGASAQASAPPSYGQTAQEATAGVRPTNTSYPATPAWVRRYGASLDGKTDDTAALTTALAVAGTKKPSTVVIDGPMSIHSYVTIPPSVTIQFIADGALLPFAATIIRYLGLINAAPVHIFQANETAKGVGGGTVLVGGKQKAYCFEWWGAIGDGSTDDHVAISNCMAQVSAVQGTIELLGTYAIHQAIRMKPNVEIVGRGKDFGTGFNLVGEAQIVFDNTCFRAAIRRCTINLSRCSAPVGIQFGGGCYNLTLEDMFVYGLTRIATNLIGIALAHCQQIVLNRVTVYGNERNSDTGIEVGTGSYGVEVIAADVEACNKGIAVIDAAQADILGVYAERNQFAIYVKRSGSGACSIRGGVIAVPGAGVAIGLIPDLSDVSIDGVNITPHGALGITSAGYTGAVSRVTIRNVPLAAIVDPDHCFHINSADGPFAGTATFASSATVAVTFAVPAPNTNYTVALGGNPAGHVWSSGKTRTGFTLNCSAANSNSTDWTVTL